jgi:uncharacterized delta-60 repeat protein
MVSEYSKINLSRYCSLRQLSTNELEGVLQNGESTLYVNEDGCLCLISKNSDIITIQRLLNQINNVKIPEFTLPDFIDEYTAYALSAVKNGNGYDLSWAKIPTALEYNPGISSIPTPTGSTKYRSIITDNLQKVNLTNQSVINQLNNYDLNVFLNEGDSTLHIENNDLYLSENTPTGITTNIFKNNSINNLTPLNFPQTQLTGNNVYCLSSKTISGTTTLDWLLVNAKLNYNTGNTITVNEIIDIVDINKTKINLSKQGILNPTGLTNNDIIDIIKKRNDYNEFILYKDNNNLILSTKNYGTDISGEYYTIKNITLSNNNIYGKEIPNFDQSTEEDYILVFLYTDNTFSSNTINDWELSWIPATPKLSYYIELIQPSGNTVFNIYKNNNQTPVVSHTLIGTSPSPFAGGNVTISTGDIFYTKITPAVINDNTFNTGNGFLLSSFRGTVSEITLQPDNKILVGGGFTTYSGTSRNFITRLNTGGTIDNTFTIGNGFNSSVTSIILQPDNKILVGGGFSTYSGTSRNRIIRLNTDGTIDNTFTIGDGFDGFVQSIILQSDNKILVGGSFSTYSGITRNCITRLNTGGTIDNTFNIGDGFDGLARSVLDIDLQPDGKILVVGNFTSYSGVTSNYIIRLNTDGTIDNTFNIGDGFDNPDKILTSGVFYVSAIKIQPDGKILVGGEFTSYSGVTANGIIRLNTGGTIDNTFNAGTGFTKSTRINTIRLQSNGKILVGGDFTSYNDVICDNIIRLNSDGSVDDTFYSGSFLDNSTPPNSIGSIVIQPDNKIIIGGSFDNFNNAIRGSIVRLINSPNSIVQLDMIIDGNTTPYAEEIFVTNPTGATTSSTFTAENSRRYQIISYVT